MMEKDLHESNTLPASKLMLSNHSRSHTKEIRNVWSTQRLRDNMTKQFKWPNDAADNIDWYSHGSMLHPYDFYQLNFRIKFIHERLPLNGVKFHLSTTNQCPCCKKEKETFEHFIECLNNPDKYKILQNELTDVYQKHKVDPKLRILVNLAIAGELISLKQVENLYPLLDLEPYETIIEERTKIGWNQLCSGRFALDWDYAQRRYSLEVLVSIEARGEPKWLRSIMQMTIAHYKSRWIRRNKILHGKDRKGLTSKS
jgi:hypothetical protein